MHPDLKKLSLLIAKIEEVETFFAQHGVKFRSIPLGLGIEDDKSDKKVSIKKKNHFIDFIFDRVAINGYAGITLSVIISREGSMETENPAVTLLATLSLHNRQSSDDIETTLVTMHFKVEQDRLTTTLLDNELIVPEGYKKPKGLAALFGSKIDQEKTEVILLKVVEHFLLSSKETMIQA